MEQMEILLNQYIKTWIRWCDEIFGDDKEEEKCYDLYHEIGTTINNEYIVSYDDRNLLVQLVSYGRRLKKPLYWVIEHWYLLTDRKMKSIHQNWLEAKNKVEAEGFRFDDYYEEDLNEVHRAKLDQDGYDVTEEYASDSV